MNNSFKAKGLWAYILGILFLLGAIDAVERMVEVVLR